VSKRALHIALFAIFFIRFSATYATHLVGGFISYQFVGTSSAGNRYKIKIVSYRDCKPSSKDFDPNIDVCIYKKQDHKLLKSQTFRMNSREKVQPIGRTDCPEATSVCLEKAIYEELVDLPISSFGYYVKWEVCCRNTQVNLRDGQGGQPDIGQTYQTVIPPSAVRNSSPFFRDVPVPYICLNDTTEVSNYAIDADGDSLVYKLVTPWFGGSSNTNYPGCTGAPYKAPEPIPGSDYETGYSGAEPFGPTGVAKINSANGITTFYAQQIGNFAVAIDLTEYRDGIELSTTRLDMQVLVIQCSPNKKPVISTSQGKSYTIIAGEKLCFDMTATDPEGQSVTLRGLGDILTGANGFKGNKATFTEKVAQGSVTSEFCWQTSCDQAMDSPYLFTGFAFDDGCPSKYTYTDIRIKVKPFTGKVTLAGTQTPCEGSPDNLYTITTTANTPAELVGVTHDVVVTNGVLQSQTTGQLRIKWNKGSAQGTIDITPISKNGCKGTPFKFTVNFIASPPTPVLKATDTMCENTQRTYTATPVAGYTYKWLAFGNGSILGSGSGNSVNTFWGGPGKGQLKLIQYNQSNCPSDTAILNIWVSKPQTPGITGRQSVCPNTSNVKYSVSSTGFGSTYQWFVTGGTFAGSSNNSNIFVNWGNEGTGFIKVREINRFGCIGDTVSLPVSKSYSLITDSITGDTDVCEFSANQVFSVTFTPKSVYNWSITGGVIKSGMGTNSIIVDWGGTGSGTLTLYETSFDSVNNKTCVSNSVTRNINIRPYPSATLISGTMAVCQGPGKGFYTLSGMAKSTYLWSVNNDTSNIPGQGTNTIQISYTADGIFNIRVIETSEFGCVGQPVTGILTVHPKPRTTPITGDSIICYPAIANHSYSVTGFPTSKFYWFADGGIITTPGNGNNISIDWSGQQLNSIRVVEVSDFGCTGDTLRLDVFFDRPSLYLNYVTVNPPPRTDDGIDVYWRLNNAPRYNNQFIIERRKAGTSDAYTNAGTVIGGTVTFNNGNTFTDSNAWEYRVMGFDLCGKPFYTLAHTNILLKGLKTSGYDVALNFSPYFGWGTTAITYDLYRILPGSGQYELYESNITSFNASYSNGLEYYTQCYRVKATKAGTDTSTWSNEICFNFDPMIFIPDAFSPNNDDYNEEFFIKGGALKSVEFKIYNRWGEKLFEGDNIDARWDGTYKGQDQAQGVYMYYCFYTGFDGRKYSTKGTITLLR
jgi:gliding motility-associated-like protein